MPGCVAAGKTEAEALALIKEAIQFHLEDMQAGGIQIPPPASRSVFAEVALAAWAGGAEAKMMCPGS